MRRTRFADVTAVMLGLWFAMSVTSAVQAETPVAAGAGKGEYVMGIFPHLPPRDIEAVFGPMAIDLSAVLKRPVMLASSTTFERFSENLEGQQFDIAFVQPFEYIKIADKYGYVPLATRTESLSGMLVTTRDSPIKTIADLKGKRVALPPESAAISYLVRLHLKSNGLAPGKDLILVHQRSHISCMQQVMIGEADACGTAAPSVRFFQNKMQVELKVIATTREIPSSLFVAHPRLPKKERELLRDRIVSWSNTPEGQAFLARGELTPFRRVSDAEYNVVREIAR